MGYILDTSQLPSYIPHTVIRGRTYYFRMRVLKQHQENNTFLIVVLLDIS